MLTQCDREVNGPRKRLIELILRHARTLIYLDMAGPEDMIGAVLAAMDRAEAAMVRENMLRGRVERVELKYRLEHDVKGS